MPATRFLFKRFIFRNLWKSKLRSGLTIIGIMLGVSILLAMNLANHTAISRFKQSVMLVSGQTNLTIEPTAAFSMDESVLKELTWLWDTGTRFTPILSQSAVPADGRREIIHVIGVDQLNDFYFRPFKWSKNGKPSDFSRILNKNTVYMGHKLAQKEHLKRNDTFQLLMNDQIQTLSVAGIIGENGLSNAYAGNLLLMDISNVQTIYQMDGRINRVDLIVPKEQLNNIRHSLNKSLPNGIQAGSTDQQTTQAEKMLKSFQMNLTALSFIALLVSMFLIYNTMSISIIRRRPEIGTLRALGTPKRVIMQLFGLEALIQGIIGSALGVAFGVFLATQAIKGISSTVELLYTGMPVTGIEVDWFTLVQAFVLGVGLTFIAAAPPILEAATVTPAESTRRSSLERTIYKASTRLTIVSLILLIISFWCTQQPAIDGFPIFGHAASLLTVVAFSLLIPWILSHMLSLLKPLISHFLGAEGRLAVETLRGSIGRTSVAVASLMVAIAMTVSLAIMIGSFRDTVTLWVQQSITADIWIEPLWQKLDKSRRINRHISETIQGVKGVSLTDDFLEFRINYNGQPANIAVGEFDIFEKRGNLIFLNGEKTSSVMKRALKNNSVIITESFAYRHKLKSGDTISLNTPKGPITLPIEGVYYDYASEHGYIIMDRATYTQYYNDTETLTGIAVYTNPDTDVDTVRNNIISALHQNDRDTTTKLNIMTNQGLRDKVIDIFDRTFAITYALHAISITVAILGIMNALFTLVLESRREFGILKYLGASRRQIQKIVLIEAGLLGLFGNIFGLFVGFLLSFLLIHVINKQSFGWTIQYSIPFDFLIQTFIIILITAILSGLLPARVASQTVAPHILREE